MKPRKSRDDHPLLHTMEESTALLRRCQARDWFWWFAGTAPFVCVLLHFLNDMCRAANAQQHLAESALFLATSYGFMKVAHAVFGDLLLRKLRGDEEAPPLPFRGKLRLVTSQLLIHSTSLWILFLASVALLPMAWVYAFYHNANILALPVFREGGRTRDLFKQAFTQCHYRPRQNHGVMMILSLFSLLVWLNIATGSALTLVLMKSITGSENAFSRNPWLFISTGFIGATMAISYMIAGPFVKACYAVRCFYGQSRKSGEDIAVQFRSASKLSLATLVLLLGLFLATNSPAASATQGSPATPSTVTIDPTKLDKSIHDVMQQDVFQWRMPRDAKHVKDEDLGWFGSFMRDISNWVKSIGTDIGKFFDNIFKGWLKDWLRGLFNSKKGDDTGEPSTPWANSVQFVLYILLGILAVALAVLLYKQWRKMPPAVAAAAAPLPEVNLESDQVVATMLEENEWLRLAQEKMDAGELRLALRALFLATLAHLGERRMIAIKLSKSNGDYVRELGFRARDKSELRGLFGDQTLAFDRAWYGWHDVTRDLLDWFRNNHQRIVSHGTQ